MEFNAQWFHGLRAYLSTKARSEVFTAVNILGDTVYDISESARWVPVFHGNVVPSSFTIKMERNATYRQHDVISVIIVKIII
jgi:hypothetical protein